MSKIEFSTTITKDSVYTSVRKQSAYLGLKFEENEGGESFEHIYLTKEQTEVLEESWTEVLNSAMDVLQPYLSGSSIDNEKVVFSLAFPSNWTNNRTYLANLLGSMFTNYVLSKWVRVAVDGEKIQATLESKYASDFNSALVQLKKMIYQRVRPTHPVEVDADPTV